MAIEEEDFFSDEVEASEDNSIVLPKVKMEEVITNYEPFAPTDVLEMEFVMSGTGWIAPWNSPDAMGIGQLITEKTFIKNIPARLLPKIWKDVLTHHEQKVFIEMKRDVGRDRKNMLARVEQEYKRACRVEKTVEDPQELEEVKSAELRNWNKKNTALGYFFKKTNSQIKPIIKLTLIRNLGPSPDDFGTANKVANETSQKLTEIMLKTSEENAFFREQLLKLLEQNAPVLSKNTK